MKFVFLSPDASSGCLPRPRWPSVPAKARPPASEVTAVAPSRRGRKLEPHRPGGAPAEMTFFPEFAGEGEEAAWVSEAGLIAVRFGQDGRLQDRHFSRVHVSEGPSLRQASARLFGR